MNILPSVAESWEQIDETTWEFNLREDVYFHNGEQLTAEDVVFTFERAADAARIAPIVGPVDPSTLEIVDEFTVRLGTAEPFSPFLSHIAHPAASILNQTAIEAYGEDVGRNPIGTGAYKFVNWDDGDSVELVRNENYFGGKPAIERLIFRAIPESSVRSIGLETGDLDVAMEVPPADVDRIANHDEIQLLRGHSLRTEFLNFNMEREPFDQVEVRRAINYAINVEEIVQAVHEGTATVAQAPIAPTVFGSNPNLSQLPFDQDGARELLAEAGLPDGFSTSLLVPSRPHEIDLATIIANQLGEVGIDVEILTLEVGAFIEAVGNGEHEIGFGSWVSITGDGDYGLFPMYHSSQHGLAGNRSFSADDQIDGLLEKARASTDEDVRVEAYHEVQRLLFEEIIPRVWIAHGENLLGVRNDVQGLVLYPGGVFNYAVVSFE